jgi:hypothetical protein
MFQYCHILKQIQPNRNIDFRFFEFRILVTAEADFISPHQPVELFDLGEWLHDNRMNIAMKFSLPTSAYCSSQEHSELFRVLIIVPGDLTSVRVSGKPLNDAIAHHRALSVIFRINYLAKNDSNGLQLVVS